MSSEGSGTSNGVWYGYTSSTQSRWFGTYECRISENLLNTVGKDIKVSNFKICNLSWSLKVRHGANGTMGVYLRSLNEGQVTVHYTITVVNAVNAGSIRHGSRSKLASGGRVGPDDLVDVSWVKDQEIGFLEAANSGVYTWKLRNLGLSAWALETDVFSVGKTKWSLQLHPFGIEADSECMSVRLQSENDSPTRATFQIIVLNHLSFVLNASEDFVEQDFSGRKQGIIRRLLDREAIENGEIGYVKDGWFTLVAHVSLDGPVEEHNQDVHQCSTEATNECAEGSECVVCLDNPQTSGVLHGRTVHVCYCKDCAKRIEDRGGDLYCPLCAVKVDRIVERVF